MCPPKTWLAIFFVFAHNYSELSCSKPRICFPRLAGFFYWCNRPPSLLGRG